ncbi:MAG: PadR family transcriptional regulator [Actinomycetota bacterium]
MLALLEHGPRYGYALKGEFEAATGQIWPLNDGQVYTTLSRLERDGLVQAETADGGQRVRVYRLTEAARAELDGRFLEAVGRCWPPAEAGPRAAGPVRGRRLPGGAAAHRGRRRPARPARRGAGRAGGPAPGGGHLRRLADPHARSRSHGPAWPWPRSSFPCRPRPAGRP